MRTSLLVLTAFCVLAAPLSADVITCRRAPAKADARVADRVASLGVPANELSVMTDADRAFFASAPERVQVAAAQQDFFSGEATLLTSELVLGIVGGLLAGGTVLYMIRNNEP